MEKDEKESKLGVYDVYHTDEGTRLIVLYGLNSEDSYYPPALQIFIHEYYPLISVLYWVILGVSIVYMVGVHVGIPLLKRFKLY